MGSVNGVPAGYHTVTPYLTVRGGFDLIDFLKKSFGAREKEILKDADGALRHAEVDLGDSVVMIGESRGDWTPRPADLYLYLQDTDEAYRLALEAGAKSVMEPANQFYGDRTAAVEDNWGNRWWIATRVEDLTAEEMERRMHAAKT